MISTTESLLNTGMCIAVLMQSGPTSFSTDKSKIYSKGFEIKWFITSTKEVMFLVGFVCLFVGLFVSNITQELIDRLNFQEMAEMG